MFDIGEKKPANVHPLDDARREMDDEDGEGLKLHPLDEPKMVALHAQLLGHYIREMDIQAENRMQMHLDEEFYDGAQWDPNDAAELEARGQKASVYNVIAPTIDWVTGSEKRSRSDFKVLPRRKNDAKPAERKSQIIKYLSDVNRTPFEVSRSFEDAVKAGLGWIDDGIENDAAAEPLYARYENWRNVFFDSLATKMDLSDGRYIGRAKWCDADVLKALFPERAAVFERSIESNETLGAMLSTYGDDAMDSIEFNQMLPQHHAVREMNGGVRQRIRFIEIWFRVPIQVVALQGGGFAGEHYDEYSPGHVEAVKRGESKLKTKMDMAMHVALMTTAGLVWYGRSPYRHNQFPLTPVWGYRRRSNGLPYGMVRRLRDIQEDVNKRASKALFILSTNKMIVEEGAAEDMDELVEEAQRPDGVMMVKPGRVGSIQMNVERDLPQYHLELMSRGIQMIQQASGVTDELLGRRTNATSGIAIQRRQDQGTMATSALFDNLRYAQQVRGDKILCNVEQFMTEQKSFRITGTSSKPEYVDVNDGLPDNDLVRSKADFVISEADWRASQRQAAVDELLELVSKMAPAAPQLVMIMLDLIIESMDIPNRDEIVRRLRQVTGQTDPEAEEITLEMQQQAQAKQAQAELQMAMAKAQLDAIVAKASRDSAQAEKITADVIQTNVTAQQKALEAAGTVLSMPGAIDIADHILGQSGFDARKIAQGLGAPGIMNGPAPPSPQPPPPVQPQPQPQEQP